MPLSKKALAAVAGVTASLSVTASLIAPAVATPPAATYTISYGTRAPYSFPTDTPASPYLDKDGTFYFQQSAALYGAAQSRYWDFYTGTNFDTATRSTTISNAANPNNPNDKNNDTTWRCNNSPTGLTATNPPAGSTYSQKNFCDLVGVWVDPDTGDWYGLVHNEFTPEPFGANSFSHYDAIDYAKSTDQGKTWTILGHAITSPYSTSRGDTTAFPNGTFYYGDGDPRLFVDYASGYFYVYYASRVVPKAGTSGSTGGLAHVARAPISSKMASSSWQKWYNGTWTEAGVGGEESNMVPVTASDPNGYTPVSGDYDPANAGTVDQQIASGELPSKSDLFVMNIAYDAYLGLYIGEPEVVSGTAPQKYYVTDDLTTQKWYLIGDSGTHKSGSWYRWFLDGVNKTSSTIVGKSFRSYCSIACEASDGEYTNVAVTSTAAVFAPVDTSKTYRISNGGGRILAQVTGSTSTTSVATSSGSTLENWSFVAVGDGSYKVINANSGNALGVDSSLTSARAWGTQPTVTTVPAGGPTVGQQWFILTSGTTYRIVNRYSGLMLAMSGTTGRLAETTPGRSWTDTSGTTTGGGRTAAQQTLTLTAVGDAAETVAVTNPGAQVSAVNTPVSLQMSATDSLNKSLTFSATGLPAGLSIGSSGLISGTPTTSGTSSVTVTGSSGTASGSTTFTWTVNAAGTWNGTHTVVTNSKALDDPGHSTSTGTQMITWTTNGGANQNWVFTQQSDGSYELKNGESSLCLDVNGGSTSAGAKIIQWTCTGGANQHWVVTALSGGGYTLASRSSGLLLTTASTSDGALVTQQADTNSALQHWTIN